MTNPPRYQAPALKKGLEILELLATSEQALTMSDISGALGRSVGEIFRMLQVLEERGDMASLASSQSAAAVRVILQSLVEPV